MVPLVDALRGLRPVPNLSEGPSSTRDAMTRAARGLALLGTTSHRCHNRPRTERGLSRYAYIGAAASTMSTKRARSANKFAREVVMSAWYPGWQMAAAWVLTVAIAAAIYFIPVTRLVDSLSNQSAAVAADALVQRRINL